MTVALSSMTAFARAGAALRQATIVWEIKAVNNKGLDIRLRLPPTFESREAACRGAIAAAVARGSVQATLSVQRPPSAPEVRIDAALLRALAAAVSAAMPSGAVLAPPTMDSLLAVRGVVEIVEPPETPEDRASLELAVTATLAEALDGFVAARHAEGLALGRLLVDHLDAIADLTASAEAAPGRAPVAIRARLAATIETLVGASVALDKDRLHQEALLLAAKADVREELDRLAIHRRSAADLLEGGGPVGRRLDFLAQELAREANTLCAKSNDAALTAIGLDLRNRIEQFREQVQNLE